MAKYTKKAQRCLDEPVLAAAGVQASGASGAGVGGWAVLGALGFVIATRIHQAAQRRATGLPLTPYMLLAVTEDRIDLLRAGSTWRGKAVIASWDRHATDVRVRPGRFVYRFELPVWGGTAALSLGAKRSRGADAVADLLQRAPVPLPA